MNTKNRKSHRRQFILAVLSLLLFWSIVITLALVFAPRIEGGIGNGPGTGPGTGSGDGDSMLSGTGNSEDKEATGLGAAEKENNGTLTGRDDAGKEGQKGPQGEEEGKPGGGSSSSEADSAGGNPDGEDDGDGSTFLAETENLIGDEDSKPIEVRKDQKNKKKPRKSLVKSPDSDGDATRTIGHVKLKGSQAGKMKGFFGSGSVSGNVIFLVDISSSMGASSPEGMQRIELLKRELKKVLNEKLNNLNENNPSNGSFMIVCFDHQVEFYPTEKKMLKFKSKEDLKNALDYVDRMRPRGGTNMKGAWDQIIPLVKKQDINCVYFLSDGEDSAFQADHLNSLKKLRIHTFSLGATSSVMKEVAKRHKGRYSEIY